MTRRLRLLLALAAPLLAGCSAQIGAGAGGGFGRAPAHFTWSSHVAASTVLGHRGLLLGAELESRSEAHHGARWTTGVRLGYGQLPDQVPGAGALELHADLGARIDDGALFPRGEGYVGGTAAYVIWLAPRRELLDVNNDQWPVSRGLELVLYGRERTYLDRPGGGAIVPRHDAGAGFALRMRLLSDLL